MVSKFTKNIFLWKNDFSISRFLLDFPKESCLWNALEAMFAQRQLNEQNCFIQQDFIIPKDIPSRDAEPRYNQYTTEELIESALRLNETSSWPVS